MERAFSKVARDRLNPRALDSGASLRGGETFSDSVKAFLNLMIENDEAPSMKRVVAAAGMSARTFQRQLKEEGASFSDLLADVRRSETLKRLKEQNLTIAAIATDLGYSDQATFTRAFRRWTGVPPSRFRASWSSLFRALRRAGEDAGQKLADGPPAVLQRRSRIVRLSDHERDLGERGEQHVRESVDERQPIAPPPWRPARARS